MGDSNNAPHLSLNGENPVYTYPLKRAGILFDLEGVKAKHYRFVRCSPVLEAETIKVDAYSTLPKMYIAISHVWRGIGTPSEPTFKVAGDSNDTTPISIQILNYACKIAKNRGIEYLWLDRLCVNKAHKGDNDWQLRKMYEIYKRSQYCIVFPGGLGNLTDLETKTNWMERGWTLQEAVAPPQVEVAFQWTQGKSRAWAPYYNPKSEHEIETVDNDCAIAPLSLLLDAAIVGRLEVPGPQEHPVYMFGTSTFKPDHSDDFRRVLPNVATLAVILRHRKDNNLQLSPKNTDQYYHCIWKSTMMRSTRDPADMIFSIMGLFGVVLHPKNYSDTNDCVQPAIDLVREILKEEGVGATWLGVSFFSPPCPHLSTFPSFPKIFPLGSTNRPTVAIPDKGRIKAPQLMLNEHPNFYPMQIEGMDAAGYLTFHGISLPVSREEPHTSVPGQAYFIRALNSKIWYPCKEEPNKQRVFAVLLGCFKAYSPFKDPGFDASNVRGFIVKRKRNTQKFSLVSYFMLSAKASDWIPTWKFRTFTIGGPKAFGKPVGYEANSELPNVELEDYISMCLPKTKVGVMVSRNDEAAKLLRSIIPAELEESDILITENSITSHAHLEPFATGTQPRSISDNQVYQSSGWRSSVGGTWSPVKNIRLTDSSIPISQVTRQADQDTTNYLPPPPSNYSWSTPGNRESVGDRWQTGDRWTEEVILELWDKLPKFGDSD